jgi:mono/diheme cytochrome c family protein
VRLTVHALAAGFAFVLLLSESGCNKTGTPAAAPTAANPSPKAADTPTPLKTDGSDKFAAAKSTFQTQCSRCHSIPDGNVAGGGKMPGRGRSLAKIGADPSHTSSWIAEHIRDPQSHNQRSKMPKFAGKLKDDDIHKLADYLATLK